MKILFPAVLGVNLIEAKIYYYCTNIGMSVLIISISYLFTKWLSNVKSMGYNADTMKRIAVGIILIAGGVAWAIINHDGPIVILPIAMIIFGFVLFVFGARHLWISRR